jgi:hypothetical protein
LSGKEGNVPLVALQGIRDPLLGYGLAGNVAIQLQEELTSHKLGEFYERRSPSMVEGKNS